MQRPMGRQAPASACSAPASSSGGTPSEGGTKSAGPVAAMTSEAAGSTQLGAGSPPAGPLAAASSGAASCAPASVVAYGWQYPTGAQSASVAQTSVRKLVSVAQGSSSGLPRGLPGEDVGVIGAGGAPVKGAGPAEPNEPVSLLEQAAATHSATLARYPRCPSNHLPRATASGDSTHRLRLLALRKKSSPEEHSVWLEFGPRPTGPPVGVSAGAKGSVHPA